MPRLTRELRFLAFSEEIGDSGTPHLQGYVVFQKRVSFKVAKLRFPGAHLEPMKGRLEHSEVYCSKQGKLMKFGDEPKDRKTQAQSQRDRYQTALDLAAEGKFDEIEPQLRTRFYKTYEHHYSWVCRGRKLEQLDKLDNHWIWGPTGTGKSRMAHLMAPNAYVKTENKWFDEYQGQPDLIIDDVHSSWSGIHQLKKWGDVYPCRVEVKGSSRMIRPERIIVTSNYSIDDCFPDERDALPMKRKFKSFHKTHRDDDPSLGLAYVEPEQKKRKYRLQAVDETAIVTVD